MTLRLSLRAWLLLSYVGVFCLPWLALVGSGALDHDLRRQTREHLIAQGHLWALRVEAGLAQHGGARGDTLREVAAGLRDDLATARARTLCATQIVDAAGVVLASTGGTTGHSLADDPEVERALAGKLGLVERERSRVRSRDPAALDGPSRFASVRSFVAVPIQHDGGVVGAVVMSRTPREELQAFAQMGPRLLVALVVAAALTVALAWTSGWLGSRSLANLSEAARRIAAGARDAEALGQLGGSHVREVGALADAVRGMHGQLQARLDYIDEFAGNVAHEFRTPIATLRGTLELLHDDPEMPAAQRKRFFANADAELTRLATLVDGLLALARAERLGDPAAIDPAALLHGLVARRSDAVALHDTRSDDAQRARIVGTARQLESALDNLIDNALRHGGDGVAIAIELGADDRHVRIAVVDDGRGIDPADLPRVFERFFTTARAGGTGLGLALVAAIVRAHGGEIAVDSRPGRTAFTITLPRADQSVTRGSAGVTA